MSRILKVLLTLLRLWVKGGDLPHKPGGGGKPQPYDRKGKYTKKGV